MTSAPGLRYVVVKGGIFTRDGCAAILASPFVSLEQAKTLLWFSKVVVIGCNCDRQLLPYEGNLSGSDNGIKRAFTRCIPHSYTTLLFQTLDDLRHLIEAYSCCRP